MCCFGLLVLFVFSNTFWIFSDSDPAGEPYQIPYHMYPAAPGGGLSLQRPPTGDRAVSGLQRPDYNHHHRTTAGRGATAATTTALRQRTLLTQLQQRHHQPLRIHALRGEQHVIYTSAMTVRQR